MSGDLEIRAEIEKLKQLKIWQKQSREYPDPGWLSTIKPELRAAIEKDFQEKDLDTKVQSFYVQANDIRSRALRESRPSSTPILTLNDWAKQVKNLTTVVLKSNIEISQVEIELSDEAISLLQSGISEAVKYRILNCLDTSVIYKRGGQTRGVSIYGQEKWDAHELETKEKIQFLQVLKLWHQKLIDIFRAAIAERESHKKEIVKKIESARKLCEEAEKVIGNIQKSDRIFMDGNFNDSKAIREFVRGWQRLDALRSEFYKLGGGSVEFADFGHPQPLFPSAAGLIATETDAARKERIFAIFEKSQQGK